MKKLNYECAFCGIPTNFKCSTSDVIALWDKPVCAKCYGEVGNVRTVTAPCGLPHYPSGPAISPILPMRSYSNPLGPTGTITIWSAQPLVFGGGPMLDTAWQLGTVA